jgi:hypothetical protein
MELPLSSYINNEEVFIDINNQINIIPPNNFNNEHQSAFILDQPVIEPALSNFVGINITPLCIEDSQSYVTVLPQNSPKAGNEKMCKENKSIIPTDLNSDYNDYKIIINDSDYFDSDYFDSDCFDSDFDSDCFDNDSYVNVKKHNVTPSITNEYNLDDSCKNINIENSDLENSVFIGKRPIEKHNGSDDDMYYKLEILSTFVNGQKEIYLLSKNIMNFRQNFIMFVSIFIGAVASLLSLKSCDDNSLLIITILNTIIVLLVGFASVFKFDVKGESYLHISNSYNKLEMHIENFTSKLDSIKDKDEKNAVYLEEIKKIEETIGNLKDDDNYTMPYVVFSIYPNLTKINIFKFIQINGHLRNSLIDNSKITDYNTNIYESIQIELYNEIMNANKYKSFWIICYFFPPEKKDGIIRTHSIV